MKEIKQDLQKLGIKLGDIILIHSSLKSMGYVIGGADAVIDAFLETLGNGGSIVMPTFTMGKEPFTPKRTASRVGKITEVFRQRKGVLRSCHPTHSIAAYGPKAEYLTKDHNETMGPFVKDGPLGKLVELDSYILFLGCGMGPNTMLHGVEDWIGLPYLKGYEAPVEDDKGEIKKVLVPKRAPGHRDFYSSGSGKIERRLGRSNIIKEGNIGEAKVQLVKARELVKAVITFMQENPTILLCDNDDCQFCFKAKELVKNWLNSGNRVKDFKGIFPLIEKNSI